MANPTSNYGWQMPTSTDLVTDLPADFEVFGQGVDTSLADLLGGTTGQVLKKNSNTDMDFVWSADSAGMTNPMTTTGDTIYSSSGSTPARLGIGSSGQVLTVSGGVPAWATASSGGMTLLSTTAVTAVSSINITGISPAYKSLFILAEEIRPGTNAVNVNIAFYSGSSAQLLWALRSTWPNGAITHTGDNDLIVMPSSTNTNPGTASVTLNNYSVAKQKTFSGSSYNYGTVGPNGYCSVYGGGISQGTITDEVRISVSSGVFAATGNIYIYGVK